MVPTASPGRKYCSLEVLRMITEGTATSLREGEEMQVLHKKFGLASLDRNTLQHSDKQNLWTQIS